MRTCKNNKLVRSGFTLIELLIVIIIIGILATITIISYNGIQDRAHFSKEQQELSEINQAVQLYYADNGTYPLCDTSNTLSYNGRWCGWTRSINFIAGLVPKYISKIPNTDFGKDPYADSYLYKSDGTDYKLIRYSGTYGLLPLETTNNALLDPARLANSNNCSIKTSPCAWGYWSNGAKDW